MALEWVRTHLGQSAFESLPRLTEPVYDREPNFGPYSALTISDMTHTVMIYDNPGTFEFLAMVVRTEDSQWFDYNGETARNNLVPEYWREEGVNHVLVYLFIGDLVATCRHGRALYSGPFTLLLEKLPIQPDSNPLFIPLHNFLCGRVPVSTNTV